MGQTRVDLLHLLEDLRDAYPGGIEDTILTEVVANSLDSGARRAARKRELIERLERRLRPPLRAVVLQRQASIAAGQGQRAAAGLCGQRPRRRALARHA